MKRNKFESQFYLIHGNVYFPLSDPFVNGKALGPLIDGHFLLDELHNLFHNAADIDYISGINDMDGHMFMGLVVPSINSPLINTPV